jgi:hypothetical protein
MFTPASVYCSMTRWLLILSLLIANRALSQVSVSVKDSQHHAPLAFATVFCPKTMSGNTTDVNGKTTVNAKPGEYWHCSLLGYKTDSVVYANQKNWTIFLSPDASMMEEFTIKPGENPALKHIKKAIQRAPYNDPERNASFSYTHYNKMIIDADRSQLNHKDSLVLNNKKLMVIESLVQRKHMPPHRDNETVLANKMSGLETPFSVILGTQIQSYSIYQPEFHLLEQAYLSPLAPAALRHYRFELVDTLISNRDTTLHIIFQPEGQRLHHLTGSFHLHLPDYSVTQLAVEPADPDDPNYIKVQQQFTQVGDLYFPNLLNATLSISTTSPPLSMESQSWMDSIQMRHFTGADFERFELQASEASAHRSADQWDHYRTTPLEEREVNTYVFMDSLGKVHHLDDQVNRMTSLVEGKYRKGWVDLDLNRILRYNLYEGFRLGTGIETNEKLSSHWKWGGYVAYGFKDQAVKYGGQMEYKFSSNLNKLSLQYLHDVEESGRHLLPAYRTTFIESTYGLFAFRMDQVDKWTLHGQHVLYRTLSGWMDLFDGMRRPFGLFQSLQDANTTVTFPSYTFSGVHVGLRWAPGEKSYFIHGKEIKLGGYFPVLRLAYTSQINRLGTLTVPMQRWQLDIDKKFKSLLWGEVHVNMEAGKQLGWAPISEWFGAKGSINPDQQAKSISIPNTFETILPNTYFAQEFVHLFIRYKMPRPLWNNPNSQPRVVLQNHLGWGAASLPLPEGISDYSHGLAEAGVALQSILGSELSGIGVGVYSRYGATAQTQLNKNLVVKMTFSMLF